MKKTRPAQPTVFYVPTLLAKDGTRHVIPSKDKAAYCGATDGSQHFPHDYRAADLCQRCVQKYMRAVLDIRLGELGL
jgi:hypothetical protein